MSTFSVVMPTRNRATLAERQVRRILQLKGSPEQMVVVDDGSEDDTGTRLAGLDDRLTLLRSNGDGPAMARNLGLDAASGEWVIFVDDDDDVFDDWMVRFRDLAAGAPGAIYLSVAHERWDGTIPHLLADSPAFGSAGVSMLAGTFAVRREVLTEVGGFDPELRHGEFTELALRLFNRTADAVGWSAHDPRPALRLAHRPAEARASVVPHVLADATCRTIERHQGLLARDPRLLANFLGVAGVARIRSGHPRTGRQLLWRAARTDPRGGRHVLRAIVASNPITRRLVWPQHDGGSSG